jgi:hypothetical protein
MKTFLRIATISIIFCLAGCASPYIVDGETFQKANDIPDHTAIVYIYWTKGGDGRVSFSLKANGNTIANMKRGGYFKYSAQSHTQGDIVNLETSLNFRYGAAGLAEVVLAPISKLALKVEPGKSYYVRCNFFGSMGLPQNYGLGMMTVGEETGLDELRYSKLLSAP